MPDPLQPDLDKARRRAAHYWLQDGLNEVTVGLGLASGLVFGWAGLVMAAGGALAFRSYRRTAPVRVDP